MTAQKSNKLETQVIIQRHATCDAYERQYEEIAERLKRCDSKDVAWLFGTIGNLMVRVAKAEARLAQIEPQQKYLAGGDA